MSAAPQYIEINAFMQHLKSEGLFLVKGDELEHGRQVAQREAQRKLMRRKAIGFSDAVKAGFFPVKTVQGLIHWVKKGKNFQQGETYQTTKGRWMVMTAAIKRLGYAE